MKKLLILAFFVYVHAADNKVTLSFEGKISEDIKERYEKELKEFHTTTGDTVHANNYIRPFLSVVALDIKLRKALNTETKYCTGVLIRNNEFDITDRSRHVSLLNDVVVHDNPRPRAQYSIREVITGSSESLKNGYYILTDDKCLKIISAFGNYRSISEIKVHFITAVPLLSEEKTNILKNKEEKPANKISDVVIYDDTTFLPPLILNSTQIFLIKFDQIFNDQFYNYTSFMEGNSANSIYPASGQFTFKVLDRLENVQNTPGTEIRNNLKETQDWALNNLSLIYISSNTLNSYKEEMGRYNREIKLEDPNNVNEQVKMYVKVRSYEQADYKNFTNLRYTRYFYPSLFKQNFEDINYPNELKDTSQDYESFYIVYYSAYEKGGKLQRKFQMKKLDSKTIKVFVQLAYDRSDLASKLKITSYEVVFKSINKKLENAPLGFYGAPLIECFNIGGKENKKAELLDFIKDCKIVGIYGGFNQRLAVKMLGKRVVTTSYQFNSINYLTPEFFNEQDPYTIVTHF